MPTSSVEPIVVTVASAASEFVGPSSPVVLGGPSRLPVLVHTPAARCHTSPLAALM
jgi:hypothetical protein